MRTQWVLLITTKKMQRKLIVLNPRVLVVAELLTSPSTKVCLQQPGAR